MAMFYDLFVTELSNDNGNTRKATMAQIRTAGTTLPIPQGLLSNGFRYVFRIRPWYAPGSNFAKYPYVTRSITVFADVLSGMIQA